MRIINATLALALLACGAPSEDLFPDYSDAPDAGVELGQTAQALTRPSYYGMLELGEKCEFGSGDCFVPSSKTRRLKFHAGTCPNWYQARMVEAENAYKPIVKNGGFTYSGPTSSGSAHIHVYCTTTTSACGTQGSGRACHYPSELTCSGGVCKFASSTIYMITPNVENFPGWSSTAEAERIRAVKNLFIHEVGHAFGLPHDRPNDGDPLMPTTENGLRQDAMSAADINRYLYDQNISMSWQQQRLLQYVP